MKTIITKEMMEEKRKKRERETEKNAQLKLCLASVCMPVMKTTWRALSRYYLFMARTYARAENSYAFMMPWMVK